MRINMRYMENKFRKLNFYIYIFGILRRVNRVCRIKVICRKIIDGKI